MDTHTRDTIRRIVAVVVVMLTILLLIQSVQAEDIDYQKGHTGLHGHTTMKDSNFVFEISARYWYPNLEIYLETWRNESDYEIILNGEQYGSGVIEEGKTRFNLTLPHGRLNLVIKIDQYEYRFHNKLVTDQRGEEHWDPEQPDRADIEFSTAEFNQFTTKATFSVFLVTVFTYWVAGKKIVREEENTIRRGFY